MQAGALFTTGHSQAQVARQLGVARQASAAGTPADAKAACRRKGFGDELGEEPVKHAP